MHFHYPPDTKQIDAAILTAYGFSPKKDLLAQLLALNQQVVAKIEKGEAVVAPGVPQKLSRREETGNGGLYSAIWLSALRTAQPCAVAKAIPEQAEADAAHYYSAKEEGPPYRTKK